MSGRILVTGCSGFIGIHLCKELIDCEWEVYGVDCRPPTDFGGIFFQHDVRMPLWLIKDDVIRGGSFDCVIHLAAQSKVDKSMDDPYSDMGANIAGTLLIAEYCVENKIPMVYAASGGTCYGNNSLDISEDDDLQIGEIHNFYGLSKAVGEKYLQIYGEAKGLNYRSLRLANVYGKGGGGVIEKWMEAVLNGNRPVLFGTGEKVRDYVYISDVVFAFLLAVSKDYDWDGSVNIGLGNAASVSHIASLFEEIVKPGFVDSLQKAPNKDYEVDEVCLENDGAFEVMQWVPEIQLKEGIEKLWKELSDEHSSDNNSTFNKCSKSNTERDQVSNDELAGKQDAPQSP